MSLIDKALVANRNYAKTYNPTQGKRPAPKIAVVTCMDPRLSDLSGILGLPQGDLDVIRTGGPAVTEDVLGELVVSTRVLGTTEILLLNHTGCGFTTFTDAELNAKLSASTGDASPAPMRFFSYKDPEENTREQIEKVTSHPWIAKDVPVRGFIFDVETGLLSEVQSRLLTESCRQNKPRGQELWYPTSREKRARCGAPVAPRQVETLNPYPHIPFSN
jgi:carbonic anhydrase